VRKFITAFFVLIAIVNNCIGQNDTINKLNFKGKKDGYWIVYLNNWLIVTDSANAFFWHYALYENGKQIPPLREKYKYDSIVYPCPLPKKGLPICMDGTFKQLIRFKNNKLVDFKVIKYNKGSREKEWLYGTKWRRSIEKQLSNYHLFEFNDFTRKYKNQKGTFYNEVDPYNNQHPMKFWYVKTDGKWKFVRIN